ncbi:hypothetical protein MAR_031385 [Mya arenaria]|uniref:Uncharacterized protein n=1 Tax=Mya arenaria TaxID=6604 RepID=A0ABY7F7M0_MYAAR|nr:hypothetical protein MAR_029053 [Mya arenaria]WAR16791.1 hypothetical protein MAR_031385 [Mya arenaria]
MSFENWILMTKMPTSQMYLFAVLFILVRDVGNRSEKQTTMTEALGGGLGGGVVGLIILAIIAMLWFRKSKTFVADHYLIES